MRAGRGAADRHASPQADQPTGRQPGACRRGLDAWAPARAGRLVEGGRGPPCQKPGRVVGARPELLQTPMFCNKSSIDPSGHEIVVLDNGAQETDIGSDAANTELV